MHIISESKGNHKMELPNEICSVNRIYHDKFFLGKSNIKCGEDFFFFDWDSLSTAANAFRWKIEFKKTTNGFFHVGLGIQEHPK